MGTIQHAAILVSTWDGNRASAAHGQAMLIFGGAGVSNLSPRQINGYQTFCVWPNGSKLDWLDAKEHRDKRDALIAWLDKQRDEDGGSYLKWIEVSYGELDSGIARAHDHDREATPEPSIPEEGKK